MTQTWPKHHPNITHSNEIYHTDGCRFCWPHGPAIFPWKWSLTRGLIWSVKESRKQQIQRRRQESPGHEIHWWWLFWSCLNLLGSKTTFGKLESSLLFCPYIYNSKDESRIVKVNRVKHDMMVLWRDFLCGLWLKAPLHRGAKSRLKRTNASSLAGEPGDWVRSCRYRWG
jgi:hypothetical protein